MTKLTRITHVPGGTLEIWTGGRCLVATPASADGPTFDVVVDDADADRLMTDPGIAMHFRADRLPDAPPAPIEGAPAPRQKRRTDTE